eukprot:scaffold103859_cov17-Tisochrysis_lutea.AAC.1
MHIRAPGLLIPPATNLGLHIRSQLLHHSTRIKAERMGECQERRCQGSQEAGWALPVLHVLHEFPVPALDQALQLKALQVGTGATLGAMPLAMKILLGMANLVVDAQPMKLQGFKILVSLFGSLNGPTPCEKFKQAQHKGN